MSSTSVNPATLEFIQKENARRSRQRKVAAVVGFVLVAGIATAGYFGVKTYRTSSQEAAAKDLVAKSMANGPTPQAFEQVRKAIDSGQFTWEQMRNAGRAAWEAEQKKRMDEYFNTPAKDREKYLDKLIDEMQKRFKAMEAARAAMGPTTRPNRERDGATTRPAGERRDREERGGWGGRNSDSTSPVDRARSQEFMAALRRRMEERGIQMPGRGGRGPGGGGGGR